MKLYFALVPLVLIPLAVGAFVFRPQAESVASQPAEQKAAVPVASAPPIPVSQLTVTPAKALRAGGQFIARTIVGQVLLAYAAEAKAISDKLPIPAEVRAPARKPDASDAFFANGEIPQLKITISKEEMDKLRAQNRQYVKATMVENGKTEYKSVGLKMKGAAGSFRGVDDRPALTINVDKFKKKQTFHDMDKIYLNNSVQDDGYFHELICSDLFIAAGLPAPRVTHARVWLNDRDLGFYVLKEGFDEKLLGRFFADTSGNFYDGGFCQDLDGNMEKDSGKGPDDKSDMKAIVDACREPDAAKRWARLAQVVDIDAFLTFTAMELMTCHWDGYARNRNNFRVYIEPKTKKAYFLPQGMDQMFGDPNFPVAEAGTLLCGAVLGNPEWKAKYRQKVKELVPLFSPPNKLQARIDSVQQRLKPTLVAINQGMADHNANKARDLKERLANRAKSLEQQKVVREALPPVFTAQNDAKIEDWYPAADAGGPTQAELDVAGRGKAYSIQCGAPGTYSGSWRRKVILMKGNYKLVATVDSKDVVPLDGDPSTAGAGLRISGGKRTNQLVGTATGKTLEFEFEVPEPMKEVELVMELKAKQGQVWFLSDSVKIVRK